MFGLWFFGIIVGIVAGAFYKVKYNKNIFNGVVLAALSLWMMVLPFMMLIFMGTLTWDGLLLIFKRILKSEDQIDSLTMDVIDWIKEEIIDF